jgi:hypothetical protein
MTEDVQGAGSDIRGEIPRVAQSAGLLAVDENGVAYLRTGDRVFEFR